MAISNVTRNLRDGELVIRDGSAIPLTLTVILDEGDLTWTQRQRTIEIKDRGSIAQGHTRKGDEESISISFSARWTQLLGKAANAADPLQLYEVLTFASGTDISSTSAAGEQDTLTFEFTVLDPVGVASERITFEKVYRESLTLTEDNEANLIAFTGRAFTTSPVIARV